MNEPRLVLADEPTGALDSRTGIEILALFQRLNRAGMTIVFVTHDLQIARHARRIVTMSDGCCTSDEPVAVPLDASTQLLDAGSSAEKEKGTATGASA